MGPTYRVAILVNGKYQWLQMGGVIYETCSSTCVNVIADGHKDSQVVRSFDHYDWRLPANPQYNNEQVCWLMARKFVGRDIKSLFTTEYEIVEILMNIKFLTIKDSIVCLTS